MSKSNNTDVDVIELLDEMSQQQGYNTSSRLQTTKSIMPKRETELQPALSKQTTKSHHFPQSGFSRNQQISCCKTNLTVEVFRRRAYERFKKGVNATWDDLVMGGNKTFAPLLKKISLPSVLEKWHFSVKLEEQLRVREARGSITSSSSSSTVDIYASMVAGYAQESIVDPILVTSMIGHNNNSKRHQHNKKGQSDYQGGSYQILFDELVLEATRAGQRLQTQQQHSTKDQFETFLKGAKFRKMVGKFHRSIQDYAQEALSSFLKDLAKQVGLEETKSTSSKKQKQHGAVKVQIKSNQVTLTHLGLSFSLSVQHYEKMQRLHQCHNSEFRNDLYVVLCRYDMLEGAGLQSSLTPQVFEVLKQQPYQCQMECFASPLNCNLPYYCSAFEDVDAPFASVGSFFSTTFTTGCYQANPPFVPSLIIEMHRHMQDCLNESSNDEPLMFIVFVPAWTETKGYQNLCECNFLVKHELVTQGNTHYYCEGTQHRRHSSQYRVASFDTSIFVLQNQAATFKFPVTQQAMNDITRAMTTTNPEMQRKTKPEKPKEGSITGCKMSTTTLSKRQVPSSDSKKKRSKRKKKQSSNDQHNAKKKKAQRVDTEKQQMDILTSLGILQNDQDTTTSGSISFPSRKRKKKR